jgi:RNA polymerase sigma factor (sigma-70 family)
MPQQPTSSPNASPTLRELAAAASRGDARAFEQIHLRLAGGVRRLLQSRLHRQPELAEELAQRTWVAVFEAFRAARYNPAKAEVSTFIYAVAYKTWLRHARHGPRAKAVLNEEAAAALAAPDIGADPAAFSQFCELLDALRICMTGPPAGAGGPASILTDDERRLLRGAALGESDRALAQRLGIAPSTVNVRKKAAYAKVREHLTRLGHAPEQPLSPRPKPSDAARDEPGTK